MTTLKPKQIFTLLLLIAGFLFISINANVLAHADTNTPTNTKNTNSPNSNISANWSGYVADTAQSYTSVGGTWAVPAPDGAANTRLATDATWVGIGGVQSHDLIQAGTQALVQNGQVQYEAWYETLPNTQHVIPLAVHGGDSVTVSLHESSPDLWHLSISNNTTGDTYEKDISYASSRSSAEWIEEMPIMESGRGLSYIPLDDFGVVHMTSGYTVADGVRLTIAAAGAQSLTMSAGRGGMQALATPSILADDSFSIARSSVASPSQAAQIQTQIQAQRPGQVAVTRHGGRGLENASGRHIIVFVTSGGSIRFMALR